jgi:ferredoxin/flavodoxin
MENRRSFLKKSSLLMLTLAAPGCTISGAQTYHKMNPKKPQTAAVFWYSQTGNTERTGKHIAATLRKNGLTVTASEYREFDKSALGTYDLIIAGTPVYYYDVPSNFKEWLRSIPDINGIPAAAYVTFGGEGGNQHNTVCTLLELLADKGGVPVGMETFGNMSTFALTWSYGNEGRVLKYKHLPDNVAYDAMRDYAALILERVGLKQPIEIDGEFDFRELFKSTPSIWSTKLFISNHGIDKDKCIQCQTCTKKCPVGAIDLSQYHVDTDRCIACLGCVNNCPEQAVNMTFMGKDVYGFNEFIRRNNIKIRPPEAFE